MIKRILQPVDLGETLSEIKIRSSFINRLSDREIILAHVVNPGLNNEDHAASRLSHFADELNKLGIKTKTVLRSGHVASEIAGAALDEKAGMIYMPASRKNFLVSSLMGSVTEDVVRLSDVPIFVHKQKPVLSKTENLKKVIFATDFQGAAERAWPYVRMLGEFVPELIILHVGERASDPYTEQVRRENVQKRLEELREKFQDDFENIRHLARIGSPARHIIDAVDQTGAELVVLGRMNEPFPSKILGSTCSRVTTGVKSSVLLIP